MKYLLISLALLIGGSAILADACTRVEFCMLQKKTEKLVDIPLPRPRPNPGHDLAYDHPDNPFRPKVVQKGAAE